MPALNNPKHEAFAQAVAKGISVAEAYEAAGYKPNAGNARRLKMVEAVVKRIEALGGHVEAIESRATEKMIERVAEKIALTREWVIDRLTENASRAMKAEQAGDGNVANRALELLGKHLGMFVDRVQVTDARYAISDEPASPDEWAKAYPTPAVTAH